MDINNDDAPCPWQNIDVMRFHPFQERLGAKFQYSAFAPKSYNLRWPIKGVEHDGDAAITRLIYVSDGLITRAREIQEPKCVVIWDSKIGSAFGTDVDVPVTCQGSACYPKPTKDE